MILAARFSFLRAMSIAMTFLALAIPCGLHAAPQEQVAELPPVQILQTAKGERFGVFGQKPAKPAPTLFVFATAIEDMHKSVFLEVGRRLAPHGYLTVALDPPCHGADVRAGEPA